MQLMSTKEITAAKAPPARSLAQEPPMATAKRMCRLLMMAQPMFSMVVPMVITKAKSAPAICTSLPTLSIRPAAGMTAMTVIRTLPSFCKKSKFMPGFLPGSAAAAGFFCFGSVSVSTASLPALTLPEAGSRVLPSAPPQTSTGVMVLTPFSFRKSRSTSATRSPAFTLSPTFTWLVKPCPFRATESRPTCTRTSKPSSEVKP